MNYLLVTSDVHLRTRINKLLPLPCKTTSRISDVLDAHASLSNPKTCIIIDDKITDGSQAELLYHLAEKRIQKPIIQLFRKGERSKYQKPLSYGNITLIAKPFSDIEFQNALFGSNLMDVEASEGIVQENSPEYHLQSIVGSSPQMCDIRTTIQQLGREQCTVHISGETGTGKELAAKALYEAGNLSGSFITENCSLLEGSLVEETLFGHKKGAFTDAHESRSGLVASAHGGMLFLDEIENLHPATQAKLLRLLETGEFRPLGSSQIQHASFRLVTAANEPLEELAKNNRLRKDFLYRINDFMLRMPPLREHKEDIPELVTDYLRKNGERRPLSNESLELLMRHDWPGNIRQLFSVLCRGSIRRGTGQDTIQLCDEDFDFGF